MYDSLQENRQLEQENARLASCLAAASGASERPVLQDILNNMERLQRNKAKASALLCCLILLPRGMHHRTRKMISCFACRFAGPFKATFFMGLPLEIDESALWDGAGDGRHCGSGEEEHSTD